MWTYPSRVAICSSHKALCSHKFEAYTPNPKEEDEEEGGNKEIDDVEDLEEVEEVGLLVRQRLARQDLQEVPEVVAPVEGDPMHLEETSTTLRLCQTCQFASSSRKFDYS